MIGVRRRQSAAQRRRHLRRTFDAQVPREWARYQGEPWRVLHRTIRERFLARHLAGLPGAIVELGSGPGRFTPILRGGARRRVVAVDLSRASLLAGRRRARASSGLAAVDWVQGVGERLPVAARSARAVVALGNLVSFACEDAPDLLDELARVTATNGLLIADFPTPVGAVQEFLHAGSRRRFLPRILRRRTYYLIDQVLRTGRQPYAPQRLCRWEFRFYTLPEAIAVLGAAGFEVVDALSVAPAAGLDDRVVSIARRDPDTWASLLEVEELAGRLDSGVQTSGGFLVCARKVRGAPRAVRGRGAGPSGRRARRRA